MFTCFEKATEQAIKYGNRKDGMYTAVMVNNIRLTPEMIRD